LRIVRSDAAGELPRGQSVYEISSAQFRGHVIAESFSHREDDGDYYDLSPFGKLLSMENGA
jgi:hypothetical protein